MSVAVMVFVCVFLGGGDLYTFTAAGVQQTILIRSRINSFKPSWGWSPWRAWQPPGPCPPPSHEDAAHPGGPPGRPAAPPPPTSRSGSASPERAPSPSSGGLTGATGEPGVKDITRTEAFRAEVPATLLHSPSTAIRSLSSCCSRLCRSSSSSSRALGGRREKKKKVFHWRIIACNIYVFWLHLYLSKQNSLWHISCWKKMKS